MGGDEAQKVKLCTMTLSPGPTPHAISPRCTAAVPAERATTRLSSEVVEPVETPVLAVGPSVNGKILYVLLGFIRYQSTGIHFNRSVGRRRLLVDMPIELQLEPAVYILPDSIPILYFAHGVMELIWTK